MNRAFEKKLIKEANAIGFVIVSFGLREKNPAGFFMYDITVEEVARRILATHSQDSLTYQAALAYQKGYQAMMDSLDVKACAYNAEIKRRVTQIKQKLAKKLLYDLIESFSLMARREHTRIRREMLDKRLQENSIRLATKATEGNVVWIKKPEQAAVIHSQSHF